MSYWRFTGGTRDERRYYQYAMNQPYSQSTQDEQECEQCSDDNNSYSNDNENDDTSQRDTSVHGGANYRDGDICNRHRQRDDQPYSEEVVSYRRRKPVRRPTNN